MFLKIKKKAIRILIAYLAQVSQKVLLPRGGGVLSQKVLKPWDISQIVLMPRGGVISQNALQLDYISRGKPSVLPFDNKWADRRKDRVKTYTRRMCCVNAQGKKENNCNPGPLKEFPGHLNLKGSGPGWSPGSKNYVTLCTNDGCRRFLHWNIQKNTNTFT